VHDPAILVLDEPFSGLDPVAVDVMSKVLREKADQGIPVVFSSHQLALVQRLCDQVGIVRSGHMVAVGSVDELRAGDVARFAVAAPRAPKGWADELPGVRSTAYQDGLTLVTLDRGADDQAVLRAALETGPVHEFAERRPTLMELFRDVVNEDTGDRHD
jgi:ABC-2 type transport system ATP-binding protein